MATRSVQKKKKGKIIELISVQWFYCNLLSMCVYSSEIISPLFLLKIGGLVSRPK